MPVYNAASWLEDALASLHRQTLADFEVVAIDDGSIDGSGEILDRWARKDPRITVAHRSHLGIVAALNHGLERCRAPLVARMDADDISHPRRFELQAGVLANRPDVGVVSSEVRHFPARRVEQGMRLYESWLNRLSTHEAMARERFVESPIAHPSVMIRRRILNSAGGWRSIDWPEDYDLWLRLFADGVVFDKVKRPLFFWREHHDRLTRSDGRYSVPSFLRCKAHFLAAGPLSGGPRVVLWGAGQTGRRLVKYLREAGVDVHRVVDIDSAKVGGTLRGIPVIGPDELPSHLGDWSVVVAAVASRGARELIRSHLTDLRLVEGRGFWCVA
jgi:glycosyltransferase involved in cell wall biosynthesis